MAIQVIRWRGGVETGLFWGKQGIGHIINWGLLPGSPMRDTKDLSQVFDFFFAFSRVLIVVECSFKFWCNHTIASNITSSFAVCFDKFFDYLIFAIYLDPLFWLTGDEGSFVVSDPSFEGILPPPHFHLPQGDTLGPKSIGTILGAGHII